jgi:hypothetical protein
VREQKLLNHLVGACKQRSEAERLRGFEVDYTNFVDCTTGKSAGLSPLEHSPDVNSSLPIGIRARPDKSP